MAHSSLMTGVGFLGLLAQTVWAGSAGLEKATRLYNTTDYEGSLQLALQLEPQNARVYYLIGKNHYMLGDFKKATEALAKSVSAEPSNSDYYLWLGRAFGRRAETSGPFTAPGYASRARQNFEKAVQLAPQNVEAMSDLFEYYLEAPGFLGGGLDKAAALANRIAAVDPSEGHYAMARLAERRKEFGTAEEQLRRAMEAAPQQVGRVIDMAKFLAQRGRFQESDQAFQSAEKIAPNSPKVLFERAHFYLSSGRNKEAARDLLKRYLASDLSPDDPPRSEAEKLLKQAGG